MTKQVLLLPRHDLWLTVAAGNGARFARLFRATWARLSRHTRRRLIAYWRTPPFDLKFSMHLTDGAPPELRACPGWRRDWKRTTVAMEYAAGFGLVFRASDLDAMPKDVATVVIAHELAHVYLWVLEGDPTAAVHNDRIEMEAKADDLVYRWGFDDMKARLWER